MGKSLTKKSRKEGENFRVSLTDIFTNIFCAFSKSTLKENKIINYYQIQTTIMTNSQTNGIRENYYIVTNFKLRNYY